MIQLHLILYLRAHNHQCIIVFQNAILCFFLLIVCYGIECHPLLEIHLDDAQAPLLDIYHTFSFEYIFLQCYQLLIYNFLEVLFLRLFHLKFLLFFVTLFHYLVLLFILQLIYFANRQNILSNFLKLKCLFHVILFLKF